MIILSKKRIINLLTILAVCLTICVIQNTTIDNKSKPTVTLPVTNKVIVIDAGHGVPDEGAQSSNGISEAETNLNIALKLQNLLEQIGATVILTRSDENAIYEIDSQTLKEKKI